MPWWLTITLGVIGQLGQAISDGLADSKKKETEIVDKIVTTLRNGVDAFAHADARIAANDAAVDAAVAEAKRIIAGGRAAVVATPAPKADDNPDTGA